MDRCGPADSRALALSAYAGLAGSLALSCATAARAEPGGTSGVATPYVTAGDFVIEQRVTAFDGGERDGDWSFRSSAAYSPTDWWRSSVVVRGAYSDLDGDASFSSVALENKFELAPSQAWPVRLGLQISLQAGLDGNAGETVVKALAEYRRDDLSARFNLNLIGPEARAAGSDEAERAYSARFMWRRSDDISIGVEGFGEPGVHYWGPRVSFAVRDATFSIGYLAGFGDSEAEGQIRLGLELRP